MVDSHKIDDVARILGRTTLGAKIARQRPAARPSFDAT
jgi:hypothetical protein